MSATNGSTAHGSPVEREDRRVWGPCGSGLGRHARWSGINIAAMVVGFMLFWPLGLVVLFWILRGRDVRELPGATRRQWVRMFGEGQLPFAADRQGGGSGNRVFETFQQTQRDRINEMREEVRERSRRFAEFRETSRRRADEEEFERFMSSVPESRDG